MKTFLFFIVVFFTILFSVSSTIPAQELSHGNFGISAVFNSTQGDILFPIWVGGYNTIAPSIGVVNIQDQFTDLSLGLVYHHYFPFNKNFAPFLGLRGGALLGTPESGNSTTDYLLGVGGGGEYFLSPNFSVGIEAQLNFTFSDEKSVRFGNPGRTNINTGSVIFASVYF